MSVHEHLERGVAVDIPRAHYDTLLWSMTTVFQVLSGENWNTVMYDGIRSVGWIAVAYFLALIFVGMFVVLNLFLAILLNNFSGLTEDDDGEPGTLAPKKLEPESPGGGAGGGAKPARRIAVGDSEAETETASVKPSPSSQRARGR